MFPSVAIIYAAITFSTAPSPVQLLTAFL